MCLVYILFLGRKSIKKNFYFATIAIAGPGFLPDTILLLLLSSQPYDQAGQQSPGGGAGRRQRRDTVSFASMGGNRAINRPSNPSQSDQARRNEEPSFRAPAQKPKRYPHKEGGRKNKQIVFQNLVHWVSLLSIRTCRFDYSIGSETMQSVFMELPGRHPGRRYF